MFIYMFVFHFLLCDRLGLDGMKMQVCWVLASHDIHNVVNLLHYGLVS